MVYPELTIQKEKLATEKYNLAVFIHRQLTTKEKLVRWADVFLPLSFIPFAYCRSCFFFLRFSFTFSLSSVVLNETSSEYYYLKGSAFLPRQQYNGT